MYKAKKPAVYGDAALHRVASTVIIPPQGNDILLLLHGIFTTLYITRQTKEPSPVKIGCHRFLTFFDMFYRKYMVIMNDMNEQD